MIMERKPLSSLGSNMEITKKIMRMIFASPNDYIEDVKHTEVLALVGEEVLVNCITKIYDEYNGPTILSPNWDDYLIEFDDGAGTFDIRINFEIEEEDFEAEDDEDGFQVRVGEGYIECDGSFKFLGFTTQLD